ncbi:hypothetical protein EHE22_09095 [Ochrobactrum pseudogrignonense]|uniref:DNA cytosine methyltransferase n=1 Tax=Brucella pseudogrignonensis TaxID=419475 RepID=A0A7Y3WWV2_9HYPH|nr:hypothetical protein [Brucella pseudogrignonensis]NNV20579.1 hypothetical protein [Brucella pseudogrignonensis]
MRSLRVLIGCEYSGTVRRAFAMRGHDAWSVDLLPSADRSNKHIVGDVRDYLDDGWDLLMVAHPPCTRLCNSGVRWLSEPPTRLTAEHYSKSEIEAFASMSRDERHAFMWQKLDEGAELFSTLWNAPIERVAIENPVMHKHAKKRIRNYEDFAQSVQPYQFGHRETKRTCLWLRGLPPLTPTTPELESEYRSLPVEERRKLARVHNASPGASRWAERSKFFEGIADAMGDQWGGYAESQVAA